MKYNQAGFSSLVILVVLVLGIIIIWELNESIKQYAEGGSTNAGAGGGKGETTTFCPTGDPANCNDSNDVFIFEE